MVPGFLPQSAAPSAAPKPGASGAGETAGTDEAAPGAAFDSALDTACAAAPPCDDGAPGGAQSDAATPSDWWLSLESGTSVPVDEDLPVDDAADDVGEDSSPYSAAVVAVDVPSLTPLPAPAPVDEEETALTDGTAAEQSAPRPDNVAGVEPRVAGAAAELRAGTPQQTDMPRDAAADAMPERTPTEPAMSGRQTSALRGEQNPAGVVEPAAMARPPASSQVDTSRRTYDAADDPRAGARAAAAGDGRRLAALVASSTAATESVPPLPPSVSPPIEPPAAAQSPVALPAGSSAPAATAVRTDEKVEPRHEMPATIISVAGSSTGAETSSQGRDFSRADSQAARDHASRAPAFATTPLMTLVAAPDGTLRLAPAATFQVLPSPMSSGETADNVDRMIRTLRVMVKERVTEATLHLRPEHFGDVSIGIRVDGKSVTAVIQTDSARVREWIQSQEAALRAGLSGQGLVLDRLQVDRDPRQSRREQQAEESPRRPRRMPASNAQQTFELSA